MEARRPARLLPVAAALLLAILCGLGFALIDAQRQDRRDAERRFAERTEVSATLTESIFSSAADLSKANNTRRYGGARISDRTMASTVARSRLVYAVVLDRRGRVLKASKGMPASAKAALSARPPLVRGALAGKASLSDVLPNPRKGGGQIVHFAVGFPSVNGTRVLVTASRLKAIGEFFSLYLARIPISGGDRAYMVDSKGKLIATPKRPEAQAGGSPTAKPQSKAVTSFEPGLSSRTAARAATGRFHGGAEDRYFTSSRLAGFPWRVVLTTSESNLYASAQGLRQWLPWLIFLGFIGAAGFSLLLLRRVVRTSDYLAEANERLEESNDTLDQRAGELARANSELEEVAAVASHNALHDALTGLPNRALFLDRVGMSLKRGQRHPGPACAILFLDFDRFKVVNDSLGHAAGDQLLTDIGDRLADCLRPSDTVARLGGDEFTILLDDTHDVAGAVHVAERIKEALTPPFEVEGRKLTVSASIGIALSNGGVEPGELVRDADTAMYRAKAAGGGRHAVFQHDMHERAVSRLNMEIELRRALEAEELGVCYQPIVELATGRIAGFEALARWEDETRGSVSPVEFIPISEETGLIGQLGRWVLGEACRQMADWQTREVVKPGMTMSVNISSRQIARSDLVEEVREVLAQTGLPGRSLRLEITESVIMDEPHAVRSVLARLADELGVTPQIDDFGTGYSSLAFLHRFPGDVLKVDRSFVAGMQHESDNREMVRAILALAHSLKMNAIAEGVETVEQLEHLRALGCEYAQGFILSKPLPANEIEALVANWDGGPTLGSRTRLRSPGMSRHV